MNRQKDHAHAEPVRHPRAGWDEHFQAMAERGDDRWVAGGAPTPTQWDETEWEWQPGSSNSPALSRSRQSGQPHLLRESGG